MINWGISRAASAGAKPASKAKSAQNKPTGKKATASELLAAATKAEAAMLKNARADKGLDPKVPKNKPFYAAAKKISTQLDRAEKGLKTKNNDFFQGISQARSAHEQLTVAWGLTDSKNKKVVADARALGNSLDMLRRDYSKEAARKKKGGALSAKEKAQFEKIKAQQKDLLAKIDRLQAKAKKDKVLQRGLAEMRKKAQRIANSAYTLDDYIAALYLLDELEGQLYGYDYYVDPAWRRDWIVVDTLLGLWAPIYADVWMAYDYDWRYVDVPVPVYVEGDIYVTDPISPEDIAAQENFVENEPFEMTPEEANDVAEEEDNDAAAEAPESGDESMASDSDDTGADMDDDGDDNAAADANDSETDDSAADADDGADNDADADIDGGNMNDSGDDDAGADANDGGDDDAGADMDDGGGSDDGGDADDGGGGDDGE